MNIVPYTNKIDAYLEDDDIIDYKSEAITIDTNNIFSEKLIINTNIEIEENEMNLKKKRE